MKASPRDLEILIDLDAACRNHMQVIGTDWVQPIDCGGTNGSDHSYRLTRLVKLGLAEQRRRGGWSRGSKSYRINDAGRQAVADTRRAASAGSSPPEVFSDPAPSSVEER